MPPSGTSLINVKKSQEEMPTPRGLHTAVYLPSAAIGDLPQLRGLACLVTVNLVCALDGALLRSLLGILLQALQEKGTAHVSGDIRPEPASKHGKRTHESAGLFPLWAGNRTSADVAQLRDIRIDSMRNKCS